MAHANRNLDLFDDIRGKPRMALFTAGIVEGAVDKDCGRGLGLNPRHHTTQQGSRWLGLVAPL